MHFISDKQFYKLTQLSKVIKYEIQFTYKSQ